VGIFDFIVNLACLLLWLNRRSIRFDPLGQRKPATLIGTLRHAESRRDGRWRLLAAIGGVLVFRAGIYWQIGATANWAGKLELGVAALSFPSNLSGSLLSLLRMLLFSFSSFGVMLGVVCLWLLLLSILSGPEPIKSLVRVQLGEVDYWPRKLKLLLPLAVTAGLWWLASWLLVWLQVIPPPVSAGRRVEMALLIGVGSYLVWKFAIGALLALHLLNSYIYFGKHPFWIYVNATARTLLLPLKKIPLRLGRVDFAPVVGIALVFLFAGCLQNGIKLFPRTGENGNPLLLIDVPGLVDLYGRLSF